MSIFDWLFKDTEKTCKKNYPNLVQTECPECPTTECPETDCPECPTTECPECPVTECPECTTMDKSTCKSTYGLITQDECGPCLERGDPVYLCGDRAYASREAAEACGGVDGTLKFIGDGLTVDDPCSLPNDTEMYAGCGFLYAKEDQANKQCGGYSNVYKFVGNNTQESFQFTRPIRRIPLVVWIAIIVLLIVFYRKRQSRTRML